MEADERMLYLERSLHLVWQRLSQAQRDIRVMRTVIQSQYTDGMPTDKILAMLNSAPGDDQAVELLKRWLDADVRTDEIERDTTEYLRTQGIEL